jgi:hypothetical protein
MIALLQAGLFISPPSISKSCHEPAFVATTSAGELLRKSTSGSPCACVRNCAMFWAKKQTFSEPQGGFMQGIEVSHANAAIQAILSAFYSLNACTADEALGQVLAYGKSDTLGLDATPEINIVHRLLEYDHHAVVITEETGEEKFNFADSEDPRKYKNIFFCDPTDRSRQIKEMLETVEDKTQRVGKIFRNPKVQKDWETRYGGIGAISGCSSAITCLRDGVPIFAVIVNYITQQLFLSCSAGNYVLSLPEEYQPKKPITVGHITTKGERVYFHDLYHLDLRRYVTFVGKAGYKENLADSRLMNGDEIDRLREYDVPGGPLRILYLSTFQPEANRLGFILSNGEKVTEWIHWLPFVMFAKKQNDDSAAALKIFEVYQDRPWTKEGILMSTPPAYSIFRPTISDPKKMVIDVSKFSNFPNPSQIRATLVVTPYDNDWMTRVVRQYGYRPIELYYE